jgi:serine/threonine protein kinase
MTPERWQQIESVLQDALDRSPSERATFLNEVCAGDEELKAEADSLLSAYLEADDFIEEPAMSHDAKVLLDVDLEDKLGREIGSYKILKRLGAGGMGEVYLAHDTRLNRNVALKLLPSYFASDDARLRRFQSEARAASALNHPNIITIYEVGEDESDYFIATEFIDGLTIRELMQQRKLSIEEIFNYVEQITSALSAAHSAGIVHRDIKPENIMLRADGLLKILDFGIAKLLEGEASDASTNTSGVRTHTEMGLVLGTVNYMSPEQARGLPVDERTDIWSLGVVLYEMLMGSLPFTGPTRMDTVVAILDRAPATMTHPSASYFQAVVNRCLTKDVSKRYRTDSELLEDLKAARVRFNQGDLSPSKRLRASSIAATLLVAFVLLTVAALVYRKRSPPPLQSSATIQPAKLYSQMTDQERLEFVSLQEHRISNMMSDRAVKLNDVAVRLIKMKVDRYVDTLKRPEDVENISAVYGRAPSYVPVIAKSFQSRKVPIIIGIYLPVIESGYRSCYESEGGARGLFQFMPLTAERYGVGRRDMCDVEKMSTAAAHYFADRMAELGEDSESLTLVLLSFNRGAESVRDSLRQLRGTENYERNFWTLLANSQTLGAVVNDENAGYVPNFFAAAIIGENPEAFGLKTLPLSSLAKSP